MPLPVVITRRAARQVEAAAEWWRENRLSAPNAFHDDLAAALMLVAEQPACGAATAGTRHRGVRRIQLPRIGYHLYYRLAPRLGQIQVLALWHARRGSSPPVSAKRVHIPRSRQRAMALSRVRLSFFMQFARRSRYSMG